MRWHGQREFDEDALDDLASRLYTLFRGAYVALLGGVFDVDSVSC